MGFTKKYLSADGLHKAVKHSLLRKQFKVMNSEYTWQDCIMSGLAVFGFKFPISLLDFMGYKRHFDKKIAQCPLG